MRVRRRLAPPDEEPRRLPTWVVLGAMRCGTGSLHRALRRHPDVHASPRKEIRFFDLRFAKGEAWYRRHFPTEHEARAHEETFGRRLLIGESTPGYLFHPLAPARLKEMLPDAKLVVLVRDPIARAVSHYRLARRKRWEALSLEEALDREPERLAGTEDWSVAHRRQSYVARGLYAEQLDRWLEHFPTEQILVCTSEELFAEPDCTFGQICRFIGADPVPSGQVEWVQRSPRSTVPPEIRARLEKQFAEPNARLYRLLGRDLGW
jgi:sulfotransferase family protein